MTQRNQITLSQIAPPNISNDLTSKFTWCSQNNLVGQLYKIEEQRNQVVG